MKFNFSLGLLFILFCIIAIFLSVTWLISVPLGMYCLMSLFVFSMFPFCHDEYESVKNFLYSMCFSFSVSRCNKMVKKHVKLTKV